MFLFFNGGTCSVLKKKNLIFYSKGVAVVFWVSSCSTKHSFRVYFGKRHIVECHCATRGHDMGAFVWCPPYRVSANQRDTRIAAIDQQQSPEASTTERWLANGWNCNWGRCTIPLSQWMWYGSRVRRSMSRSICFFSQQAFNHQRQLVGRRRPSQSFVNWFAASVRPLVHQEQQRRRFGIGRLKNQQHWSVIFLNWTRDVNNWLTIDCLLIKNLIGWIKIRPNYLSVFLYTY